MAHIRCYGLRHFNRRKEKYAHKTTDLSGNFVDAGISWSSNDALVVYRDGRRAYRTKSDVDWEGIA